MVARVHRDHEFAGEEFRPFRCRRRPDASRRENTWTGQPVYHASPMRLITAFDRDGENTVRGYTSNGDIVVECAAQWIPREQSAKTRSIGRGCGEFDGWPLTGTCGRQGWCEDRRAPVPSRQLEGKTESEKARV
jgi:hypothetical protein